MSEDGPSVLDIGHGTYRPSMTGPSCGEILGGPHVLLLLLHKIFFNRPYVFPVLCGASGVCLWPSSMIIFVMLLFYTNKNNLNISWVIFSVAKQLLIMFTEPVRYGFSVRHSRDNLFLPHAFWSLSGKTHTTGEGTTRKLTPDTPGVDGSCDLSGSCQTPTHGSLMGPRFPQNSVTGLQG